MASAYTPVQSARLYEQIADQIKQRILSGEIRHGERLPTERELSQQFSASRTAVREAMKSLAQQGLIEIRPGRGTIVVDDTSRAMRDSLGLAMQMGHKSALRHVVEIRAILEPEIAARAAARATGEDLAAIAAALADMDRHLDGSEAFLTADEAFHSGLAQATHNPLILMLLDPIMDLLRDQRRRTQHVGAGPVEAQAYHRQIYTAVAARDPQAARQAMLGHLEHIQRDSDMLLAMED